MATSARIIAYSTSPWPFSLGANNIITFLSKKIDELPEDLPQFQRHDYLLPRRLHPKT
jgi:hypothetical protein